MNKSNWLQPILFAFIALIGFSGQLRGMNLIKIDTVGLGQGISQGMQESMNKMMGPGGTFETTLGRMGNDFMDSLQKNSAAKGKIAQTIDNLIGQVGTTSGGTFFKNMSAGFKANAGTMGTNIGGGLKDLFTNFSKDASDGLKNLNTNFNGKKGGFRQMNKGFGKSFTELFKPIMGLSLKYMLASGGIFLGVTGGGAALYYGFKHLTEYWKEKLLYAMKKPDVIVASSKKTFWQKIKALFGSKPLPKDMIFGPELFERLIKIAKGAKIITQQIQAGKKNAKYRNVLLWGPPGTGKTMFAQELAIQSGMDWVIVTGASFAQEGAIERMNELFKWINGRSTGTVLFIDECEAFLADRKNMDPQSQAYKALTNFLSFTGEASNKVMIVFATNKKDILDPAIWSRIKDEIEVGLPALDERKKVLALYIEQILFDGENDDDFIASAKKMFNKTIVHEMGVKTEGLANRELADIIQTIKVEMDLNDNKLTKKILDTVVDRFVEKNRKMWLAMHTDATPAGKKADFTPAAASANGNLIPAAKHKPAAVEAA